MRHWHIIGYDVYDPKRLRKVARTLSAYGHRIQFSVFQILASPRQIERLRWELSQVLDDKDHLLIVRLCPSCADNVIEQSGNQKWDPDPPTFKIIG